MYFHEDDQGNGEFNREQLRARDAAQELMEVSHREAVVIQAIFLALGDALSHSDMEERVNGYLAPGAPDNEASDDELTATIDHMQRIIQAAYFIKLGQ